MRLAIPCFLCYWWVHPLMGIMLYDSSKYHLRVLPASHHLLVLTSCLAGQKSALTNDALCMTKTPGALLITENYLNYGMDKQLHTLFVWDVITYAYSNFNSDLIKLPLKLGHTWVHPTVLHGCNYLSMSKSCFLFNWLSVSKMAPSYHSTLDISL